MPKAHILRKAHPDSKYTGLRGTARVIGQAIGRAVTGGVTENSGLSGNAARSIRGNRQKIDSAVEAAQRSGGRRQGRDHNRK